VVAVTWLFRRRVDRRGWRDLGLLLPGRPQLVASGAGFALGTLTIVAFFGVLRALGWARVDGGEVAERGVAEVVALLAAGLVMYATSALVQELAFRGYFFQNLAERLSIRTAAVVAGLIFAVLHLPGAEFSVLLALVVADLTLMACFLTLTRLATGSLWLAIGFQTAWNWTMDYVFSVDTAAGPDYGNALVNTRVGGPDLLGPHGGVELLYALISALLLAGYWLFNRRHRYCPGPPSRPPDLPGCCLTRARRCHHGCCQQRAAGAVGAEHRAGDPAPGARRAGRRGKPTSPIARWCMPGRAPGFRRSHLQCAPLGDGAIPWRPYRAPSTRLIARHRPPGMIMTTVPIIEGLPHAGRSAAHIQMGAAA
jgi:hypothetical protein